LPGHGIADGEVVPRKKLAEIQSVVHGPRIEPSCNLLRERSR
jgi:hypothetical protein